MSGRRARHRWPGTGRSWRPSSLRGPLISVGVVAAVMAAAVALVRNASSIDPPPSTAPPSSPSAPALPPAAQAIPPASVPRFCATLYELHGTDCAKLPIVTDPGALGPANAGGPGGGTDWEPAYPGSNVWIPEDQITGRLFVVLPDSSVAPPDGDKQIGQLPDGATLYWDPTAAPDPAVPDPAAPDPEAPDPHALGGQ